MRATVAATLVALWLIQTVSAAPKLSIPRPDPFADPKNDPYNPLRYIANNVLTAIAFSLVVITAFSQTFLIFKYGAKWMSAMTIGLYCFAIGIGCRFGLHYQPQSKGIYIVEYLFVVLSPCAFIAADYVLLGRLAAYLESGHHLLIRPRRIVLFFVLSDVTTFLIQAGGGSVLISANTEKTIDTGNNIFLAGLALQLLSFVVFTIVYLLFLFRVKKHEPQMWNKDAGKPWMSRWNTLAIALLISCVGIIIRSIFRTIEISEGFRGKLSTTEAYFYGLDTLPLFIATAIYVPFWPGRFIPPMAPVEKTVESTRGSAEKTT